MRRYICLACGWIHYPAVEYPASGSSADTPFEDLPEDWVCPACEQGKDVISAVD